MDAVTPDPAAWPAPAKLNLMLRIVGRRPDGYHRLQTVFQFLDRGDWLWFDVRDDGRIERAGGFFRERTLRDQRDEQRIREHGRAGVGQRH